MWCCLWGLLRLWGAGLAAERAAQSLFATLFGYFFSNTTSESGKALPKHEKILSFSISLGDRLGVEYAKSIQGLIHQVNLEFNTPSQP